MCGTAHISYVRQNVVVVVVVVFYKAKCVENSPLGLHARVKLNKLSCANGIASINTCQ